MISSLFCTNCTISIPHVHIFVCITIQFSMLESFSHSLILLHWFPNCSNLSFKVVYILHYEILPYTSFGFFQHPSSLHHHHLDFPIPTRAANFNPKEDHIIINPYPTAFPYGNGMVLHFYQQQESSTTKTVHKVINKGLKTYV